MSMGIELDADDVAYRCNLVTVQNGIMVDFSAGHISSPEGSALFASLEQEIPQVQIRAGISYRNLLVVHRGNGSASTPPHDIVGKEIAEYLPKGGDAALLLRCMEKSREVFANHPVNDARRRAGKHPATGIWPWSGGHKPLFPRFEEKYGKKGGMISAVDLLNGIARCAGMEIITVPVPPVTLIPIMQQKGGMHLTQSGTSTFSISISKHPMKQDIWEILKKKFVRSSG